MSFCQETVSKKTSTFIVQKKVVFCHAISKKNHLINTGVSLVAWYKDLYQSGLTYGLRAGVFPDVYKAAKVALEKAFAEVVAEKKNVRNTRCYASAQNASAHASGEEG